MRGCVCVDLSQVPVSNSVQSAGLQHSFTHQVLPKFSLDHIAFPVAMFLNVF